MTDTKTKILDLAESLTQTRGFNGFSYIDLANEIGIKTASIHYHFKLKDDLAAALVERLREQHALGFAAMEAANETPEGRLQAAIDYFKGYLAKEEFCMCGMMAAELQSVSPRVASLVKAYFRDFEAWLRKQFELAGRENADELAIGFLSTLEGSLLIARLTGDADVISKALKGYLKE